jgi:ABC-type multidrug transport system fused ATPase/permease subunit
MEIVDESADSFNSKKGVDIRIIKDVVDPGINPRASIEVYRAMALLEELASRKTMDSWTNAQENMLTKWAKHAMMYRQLHIQSSEYYRFLNDIFAYPIILVSSVLGMGGFVMISDDKPSQLEMIMAYIMAGCNIIVAFLSSIQKLKRFSELAEQHQLASVEYLKFHREIKMELILDRGNRSYATDFCRDAKHQYDRLATNYPGIPRHIVDKYYRMKDSSKPKPNHEDCDNTLTESDV